MSSPAVRFGIDVLAEENGQRLKNERLAVLMNRASVDAELRFTCDVVESLHPGMLQCILTPQHGLWGEQQANMIESDHSFDRRRKLPIYSLYSASRRPTTEMLRNVDTLVVDLQDVGTRVYTFIWTLLYCLEECGQRGIRVVVLDRPNPIGGVTVEGHLLNADFRSFVGEAEIPMRHGLTIGELARLFNAELATPAALEVVPVQGWRRAMFFEQSQHLWIPPSPNMPTVQTAVVYPGQVLLEGTNLSEGRGTTTPFEVVGAPWIEASWLADYMNDLRLPGVLFHPLQFTPTFDKWAGHSCQGVSILVTDRAAFRSWDMTIELLAACVTRWPGDFKLIDPPYEYEHLKKPLDIISGGPILRGFLEQGRAPEHLLGLDAAGWWNRVKSYLLYPN